MFYDEETPRFTGSKIVAGVLAIPGLLLIGAGVVALLLLAGSIGRDPMNEVLLRAQAAESVLLLATGIAMLGATVVILLLINIAQAEFRAARHLEELLLEQKAVQSGTRAQELRSLAATR